jgi:hypothetical protein
MARGDGWERFVTTPLGQRVGVIIEDRDNVLRMITLSEHGLPAVQAVGKALLALGPEVQDDWVKQTIGRWVRSVLGARGWVPLRSGRVARDHLFSTGMIYQLRDQLRGVP